MSGDTPSHQGPDPRALAAWRAWLRALASDAEAAFAAALAYDSLDDRARDTWLDALEQDAPGVDVPRIAIYAPLLSVEKDPDRLARIRIAIGDGTVDAEPVEARALRGVATDGSRVVVLVLPIYLSFVQVFACRFHVAFGFSWAKHDPFARDADAPRAGGELDGTHLERTPMNPVVEELAHAVLAQQRRGLPAPPELRAIIDLFSPKLEDEPPPTY
jgi:hypothetical protein